MTDAEAPLPFASDGSGGGLPGEEFRTAGLVFGQLLGDPGRLPAGAWVAGLEPWWDVTRWDAHARSLRGLRRQLGRAGRCGVVVSWSWLRDETSLDAAGQQLAALLARWRAACRMPPMAFAASSRWEEPHACAWLGLAWCGERLVGAALALPRAPGVWCLVHLVRDPEAPQGTVELLVDKGMRALAGDGARWVTLGLMPLEGPVPPLLARVRPALEGLFPFAGLAAFKRRFRPDLELSLLVVHPDLPVWVGVLRLLRAFTGVGFRRYARSWLRWAMGYRVGLLPEADALRGRLDATTRLEPIAT
ncbi:MAG: phosphatidylglycerol lysyltransferase domain-containing protein [Candidatus Sericytochromatia bacterium]|nr:phosphatidylglycerol lysyltransferase domain-containing protein [Candidatus Sericytochromatia bacterium]